MSAGRAAAPIQHVIIVSVDGLMPASYLEPEAHGLSIPTLRELARNGASSDGAQSVLPSVTYPSHTAIATGTNPGTSGIVNNVAWDPLGKNSGGWQWYTQDIRVPTLWMAAQQRGLRTALVWWPVTVGAQGTVVVPEFWRASTPDDVKLIRAMATPGILDAVEKRFPDFRAGFTPVNVKDAALTDIAVHVIETVRPNLVMLHLLEVDHEQHEEGLWSDKARAAIENADRQIARLIAAAKKAGIWERTALVVVSDHGFLPIAQRVRPGVLLRERRLITLDEKNQITDWKAVLVPTAGCGFLYVKDPNDQATRDALLSIFRPLAGQPGSGIARVLTAEEIQRKGGDKDAFLYLEAADGFGIAGGYTGDYISPATVKATHGYDPERPEMRASLLMYGPSIAPGRIPDARLIDVAPTVARWLHLSLPQAEGKPLPIRVNAAPVAGKGKVR